MDGVFIGPADLSASLGHVGDPAHPEVQAAIADAFKRIQKAGKAVGILTPQEPMARKYLEMGASFVAVGLATSLLVQGTTKLIGKFKSDVGSARWSRARPIESRAPRPDRRCHSGTDDDNDDTSPRRSRRHQRI